MRTSSECRFCLGPLVGPPTHRYCAVCGTLNEVPTGSKPNNAAVARIYDEAATLVSLGREYVVSQQGDSQPALRKLIEAVAALTAAPKPACYWCPKCNSTRPLASTADGQAAGPLTTVCSLCGTVCVPYGGEPLPDSAPAVLVKGPTP